MSSITHILPPERGNAKWSLDEDRVWITEKHRDSIETYVFDYTALLPTGRTIASVSLDPSGVNVDSNSNTTTTVTVQLSDTSGSLEIELTLDNGDVLVELRRFVPSPLGDRLKDYRGGLRSRW